MNYPLWILFVLVVLWLGCIILTGVVVDYDHAHRVEALPLERP